MTGRVMAVAVCMMVLVSVSAHAAARNPDKAAIDRYVERTWPTKKAKLIKWVIARYPGRGLYFETLWMGLSEV